MSELYDLFAANLSLGGLTRHGGYAPEYRFAAIATGGIGPGVRARLRRAGMKDWRFDFAWADLMIAAEVEGGTWAGGRHIRGQGFEDDCEKYNTAALLGFRVFRFTGDMVRDGRAFATMQDALKGE